MGRIAPYPRIVIEQPHRHEIYFLIAVGMRGGASARPAKSRRPAIASRYRKAADIVFSAQPAKALNRGVENGIAVSAGQLSALLSMSFSYLSDHIGCAPVFTPFTYSHFFFLLLFF